jgi:heme-degrading monooxygenase HmoA
VKPGQEDEFVRRWNELAEWSAMQGLSDRPQLLRDFDNPRRFVSFAPWQSIDTVARWRSSVGFNERMARLQEVLDGFEPSTLVVVAER